MCPVKQADAQIVFKQVDLLDHGRGGDLHFLGRLIKAAGLGNTDKSFKVDIFRALPPPLSCPDTSPLIEIYHIYRGCSMQSFPAAPLHGMTGAYQL